MDIKRRLEIYIKEAYLHLDRIKYAKSKINFPIEIDDLEEEEIKDKLDVIAFRFSKLPKERRKTLGFSHRDIRR